MSLKQFSQLGWICEYLFDQQTNLSCAVIQVHPEFVVKYCLDLSHNKLNVEICFETQSLLPCMRSHILTQHHTKEAEYCFSEKALFSDGSSSIAYCNVHTLTKKKIVSPSFKLTKVFMVHHNVCRQDLNISVLVSKRHIFFYPNHT